MKCINQNYTQKCSIEHPTADSVAHGQSLPMREKFINDKKAKTQKTFTAKMSDFFSDLFIYQ